MRDLIAEYGITILWLIVSTVAMLIFIDGVGSLQFSSLISIFLNGVMG